jgi:hypothetical protein
VRLSGLLSVRRVLESYESYVIQGWWPDSRRGHRCGAFAAIAREKAAALIVNRDGFFNSRREQIVALALRHAVPAIYESREHVASGGLMSYGPQLFRYLSHSRQLRRANSQGCEARRPASSASNPNSSWRST